MIELTPELLELLELVAEKGAERALERTRASATEPRQRRGKKRRQPTADDHETIARMNARKGIRRPT